MLLSNQIRIVLIFSCTNTAKIQFNLRHALSIFSLFEQKSFDNGIRSRVKYTIQNVDIRRVSSDFDETEVCFIQRPFDV